MKLLYSTFLALPLTIGTNTVLSQDNMRAYMLASSCAACHGTSGDSPGAIPSLQGKSAKLIELALQEFKSGASEATVMNRLARGYSDEEIKLIADYYGKH